MEKPRPGACRGGAFYTLDGQGQTRFPAAKSQRWTSSPSSSSSPAPIFPRWKVPRSFSGAEIVSGEADEAGGQSPGHEENEAGRGFRPEKPYLPLFIEGSVFGKQTMRFAMAKPVFRESRCSRCCSVSSRWQTPGSPGSGPNPAQPPAAALPCLDVPQFRFQRVPGVSRPQEESQLRQSGQITGPARRSVMASFPHSFTEPGMSPTPFRIKRGR